MKSDRAADVLVIGGGPVGLSATLLLARLGLYPHLVERGPNVVKHPRATLVNTRTMELFRRWGIDRETRQLGASIEQLATIRWMTSLSGRELGRLDIVEDAEKLMRMTAQAPVLPAICAQNKLEQLLRKAVAECGAAAEYGTEVIALEQDEGAVRARVVDSASRGDERVIEAGFALGCDGASSTVRRQLGIDLLERCVLGELIDIHFHAELGPHLSGRRSALYWLANPKLRGVLIAVGAGTNEWLLNRPFFRVEGESGEHFDRSACLDLVRAAVGVNDLEAEIHSVRPWRMHSVRARRFRAGRTFLLGDAAHQFPPTGGFGMNTGIQDAHNLAWKLAAVSAGEAGKELLDSYEAERAPVADFNGERSVLNAEKMRELLYGMDDGELAALDGDGPAATAARERFARAIPEQRPHFDFQGQALGFAYESEAVLADGSDPPRPRDPIVEYVPTARPGSRAPHVWLRDERGERSTLDLFDDRFALLAPAPADHWRMAAEATFEEGRVAIHSIGTGGDFEDPHGEFARAYGLGPTGAVLVRPDGHVAWRASTAPECPRRTLEAASAALACFHSGGEEAAMAKAERSR